jgi:hypothetical protein
MGPGSCGQPLKVGREPADHSGGAPGVLAKPLHDFLRHGSCEGNASTGFALPQGRRLNCRWLRLDSGSPLGLDPNCVLRILLRLAAG